MQVLTTAVFLVTLCLAMSARAEKLPASNFMPINAAGYQVEGVEPGRLSFFTLQCLSGDTAKCSLTVLSVWVCADGSERDATGSMPIVRFATTAQKDLVVSVRLNAIRVQWNPDADTTINLLFQMQDDGHTLQSFSGAGIRNGKSRVTSWAYTSPNGELTARVCPLALPLMFGNAMR